MMSQRQVLLALLAVIRAELAILGVALPHVAARLVTGHGPGLSLPELAVM